jgi:hypothetical protein
MTEGAAAERQGVRPEMILFKNIVILFVTLVSIEVPEGANETAREAIKDFPFVPETVNRNDIKVGPPIPWYKIWADGLEPIAEGAFTDPREVGKFMGYEYPFLCEDRCLGSTSVIVDTLSKTGFTAGVFHSSDRTSSCVVNNFIAKNPDIRAYDAALIDYCYVFIGVIFVDEAGGVFVIGPAQKLVPFDDVKQDWVARAKRYLRL